jgi:hypothetical protein
VSGEIGVYPSYPCPHCHALLEPCQEDWHGWVSCPQCGLPGLPPAQVRSPKASRRPVARQSSLFEGAARKADGMLGEPAPPAGSPSSRKGQSQTSSAPLLIVSSGLFVSAFLLLVAYLDRSTQNMSLFGTLTIVFLVVLVRMRMSRQD